MDQGTIGALVSSRAIVRHPANPILSSADVPYRSTLVFNPGVTKFERRYVMAFRNDFCPAGCKVTFRSAILKSQQ